MGREANSAGAGPGYRDRVAGKARGSPSSDACPCIVIGIELKLTKVELQQKFALRAGAKGER